MLLESSAAARYTLIIPGKCIHAENLCAAGLLVISSLPVVGRNEWICYSRCLGTMLAPQWDFRAPNHWLTHNLRQKSHSISSSAVHRLFCFYGGALSNPWHTVRIHLHSEASANFLDGHGDQTRERGEGKEWGERRKVKSKCFLGDFCICSSQAAEVVNQPFSSYCIYFNSSSKSPHTGMQPLLHGGMKRGMALILSLFHIFILVDGFLSLMQKEGESVGVQKHTSHKSWLPLRNWLRLYRSGEFFGGVVLLGWQGFRIKSPSILMSFEKQTQSGWANPLESGVFVCFWNAARRAALVQELTQD